jgi:hypothetical protein
MINCKTSMGKVELQSVDYDAININYKFLIFLVEVHCTLCIYTPFCVYFGCAIEIVHCKNIKNATF